MDTPSQVVPTPPSASPEPTPKPLNKLVISLATSLLVALGLIGVLTYRLNSVQKSTKPQASASPTIVAASITPLPISPLPTAPRNPAIETIMKDVRTEIAADASLSAYVDTKNMSDYQASTIQWTSDDGWNASVHGVSGINMTYPETIVANPTNIALTPQARSYNEIVRKVLSKYGFRISAQNSSSSETDDVYLDYVQSYKNDSLACRLLLTTYASSIEPGGANMSYHEDFACASLVDVDAAITQQKPFLTAAGFKPYIGADSQARKNAGTVIGNLQIDNDRGLATGGIGSRANRGGAAIFFYRDMGVWKEIVTAQAVPGCDEFVKKNVPEKYWLSCYEKDASGNYKANPRPMSELWTQSPLGQK